MRAAVAASFHAWTSASVAARRVWSTSRTSRTTILPARALYFFAASLNPALGMFHALARRLTWARGVENTVDTMPETTEMSG